VSGGVAPDSVLSEKFKTDAAARLHWGIYRAEAFQIYRRQRLQSVSGTVKSGNQAENFI